MSILIKGMEMPKSCAECDIKRRCFGDAKYIEWLSYHPAFYEERLTKCPLIELPPHGDLIDRDALPTNRVEWEDIVNAPTIIEAEESK